MTRRIITALRYRGVTHFQNSRKQESQADFEALIRLADAPLENVAQAHLLLSEIHLGEGRWSEGFQALEANLEYCLRFEKA